MTVHLFTSLRGRYCDPSRASAEPRFRNPARWKWARDGHVPAHGVVSGEGNEGVEYVGRAYHDGALCIGRIVHDHKTCYIPFYGEEVAIDTYQVRWQRGEVTGEEEKERGGREGERREAERTEEERRKAERGMTGEEVKEIDGRRRGREKGGREGGGRNEGGREVKSGTTGEEEKEMDGR